MSIQYPTHNSDEPTENLLKGFVWPYTVNMYRIDYRISGSWTQIPLQSSLYFLNLIVIALCLCSYYIYFCSWFVTLVIDIAVVKEKLNAFPGTGPQC